MNVDSIIIDESGYSSLPSLGDTTFSSVRDHMQFVYDSNPKDQAQYLINGEWMTAGEYLHSSVPYGTFGLVAFTVLVVVFLIKKVFFKN